MGKRLEQQPMYPQYTYYYPHYLQTKCLWDGGSGLDPGGCQDTGWALYPDIIKGLTGKPFGGLLYHM
ncbi:unnamed protein product [Pleuronectes platessa]|uniref:Uncharacterized protein n=1 Tax=Pleuronectes platessa TaxID=8262 RepID=A0A9N7URK0_PLEPL|nr:unnamed protein product [Pleuronectes platessa]